MKRLVMVSAIALLALAGCRREDIRELTVVIPDLAEANRQLVVDALKLRDSQNKRAIKYYDGIREDSFVFDFTNHTFTVKYDSMCIAHTNIRMLLAEAGLKVEFPENHNGM